jgi:hypothetical protein
MRDGLQSLRVGPFHRLLKVVSTRGFSDAASELWPDIQEVRFHDMSGYALSEQSPEFIARIRETVRHLWEVFRHLQNQNARRPRRYAL